MLPRLFNLYDQYEFLQAERVGILKANASNVANSVHPLTTSVEWFGSLERPVQLVTSFALQLLLKRSD